MDIIKDFFDRNISKKRKFDDIIYMDGAIIHNHVLYMSHIFVIESLINDKDLDIKEVVIYKDGEKSNKKGMYTSNGIKFFNFPEIKGLESGDFTFSLYSMLAVFHEYKNEKSTRTFNLKSTTDINYALEILGTDDRRNTIEMLKEINDINIIINDNIWQHHQEYIIDNLRLIIEYEKIKSIINKNRSKMLFDIIVRYSYGILGGDWQILRSDKK